MSAADSRAPLPNAERRVRRREARAALGRADILDAAERVFADRGLDGSLRDIARQSGFSAAAIYNYFENKQHLYAETLSRRGVELLAVLDHAALGEASPLVRLHAIADGAIDFFEAHPDFGRMLRRVKESDNTIPSIVREHAGEYVEGFSRSLALMVDIVEEGQRQQEIRGGPSSTLVHIYMTLVYEHVFLVADDSSVPALELDQFHDLLEGALRAPR